jgi:hypothetical protein
MPASAQFFLKPPELAGEVVTGAEPGVLGIDLPDATPAELRAALVWNLRAALNVAALQCQFAPTLLTVDNYNALIKDHAVELKKSYDTLGKYFIRVNKKNVKAGQNALDQFGTRVYSGFSTISAQYTFCATADKIGSRALFTPVGRLGEMAGEHMREMRNSLKLSGEQLYRYLSWYPEPWMPPFSRTDCWTADARWNNSCGGWAWELHDRRVPAGPALAQADSPGQTRAR